MLQERGSCERLFRSKEPVMYYGKTAAKIIAILAVTLLLQIVLHPG